MRIFIKKLCTTALATATACGLLFATTEIAMANPENGLNAGISAVLSNSLMDHVASVQEEEVSVAVVDSKSVTANIHTEDNEKDMVNSELYSVNEDGTKTICGYVNLGIAKVKGNLNVRKEASQSSAIVGKMTNHAGCEVLEEKDGWCRIQSGNVKGWVSADYLLTGDQALEVVNDAAAHVAKVTTQTLRVRTKPSTKSSVMTTVAKGEMLEVIEELDGWIKISIDNEEGYISSDYAKASYELREATTLAELNYGGGVSDVRVSLVQFALKYVGGRYVWGGTSLSSGVDCSGFTMQVYRHFGYSLPHYSGAQSNCGTRIRASEAKPGDLFFYGSGSRISHVAIYIGNGQIVHASSPRSGIKISSAYYRTPIKVVRIINP